MFGYFFINASTAARVASLCLESPPHQLKEISMGICGVHRQAFRLRRFRRVSASAFLQLLFCSPVV